MREHARAAAGGHPPPTRASSRGRCLPEGGGESGVAHPGPAAEAEGAGPGLT